jgi:large subunit ribosomal protein L5
VVPKLKAELKPSNPMQVPRITKITVNMGVGEAVADRKVIDAAVGDMTKITGQKPIICKSKKAIAAFKVREGLPIGCKVTLRGARMYEFLDRLISIAMPRIRDFRGVSPRGLRRPRQLQHGREGTDHFPGDPVRPDRSDAGHGHHDHHHGRDNKQGRALLEAFSFPFRK